MIVVLTCFPSPDREGIAASLGNIKVVHSSLFLAIETNLFDVAKSLTLPSSLRKPNRCDRSGPTATCGK